MKKRLIVLSSPSGGGKSTVAKYLLNNFSPLRFSISATTRNMRPGEQNGKEYYFLSKEEFLENIANNQLVEYEEIFGNFYGTLKSEIDNALLNNENLLFDVDVKGAVSLSKKYPDDCLLIFISPPDLITLENRLRSRKTESEEQIQKRIARAKLELEYLSFFTYHVINDKLEDTLNKISEIISLETSLNRI